MENKKINFIYDGEDNRVDIIISTNYDITRSRIKKLAEDGFLFVNGAQSKANKKCKNGDLISLEVPKCESLNLTPIDIPLDIVYQDESLAVINKPQGLTVHAGNGTLDEVTLVNALLYHLDSLSGINGVIRPGIVHRIDKNTSGLLVVAKNDKAHVSLSKQIEEKTCKRIYVALLEGNLKSDSGTVNTFIGRDVNNRTKMAVTDDGKIAITKYKVLKRYQGYTLCEFSLKTGRTHQIRVHAKYLGNPVVGDKEYGFKKQRFNLDGQLLHAKKLIFRHPETNQLMIFEAPIPKYFEDVLNKLKDFDI